MTSQACQQLTIGVFASHPGIQTNGIWTAQYITRLLFALTPKGVLVFICFNFILFYSILLCYGFSPARFFHTSGRMGSRSMHVSTPSSPESAPHAMPSQAAHSSASLAPPRSALLCGSWCSPAQQAAAHEISFVCHSHPFGK